MSSKTETPDQRSGKDKYDPGEDVISLKGKSYLEVKNRLKWLRDEQSSAKIITKLLELTNERAVFQAHITLANGAEATGHGSETPKDFGDYIEKAETKAIGRALGALGYGTQFIDSELDGNSGPRVVDAPVSRGGNQRASNGATRSQNVSRDSTKGRQSNSPESAKSGTSGDDGEQLAKEQKAFLQKLAREKGFSSAELRDGIEKHFGIKNSLDGLTSKQGDELQNMLNDAEDRSKKAGGRTDGRSDSGA